MKLSKLIFTLLFTFFTTPGYADELKGDGVPDNVYLDGGASDKAVILCHGRGQYPTWDVVDPLRKGIHEQLGFHTVSIQMPTGSVGWRQYADFFPDAYTRIASTASELRTKGIKKIYLMGHSMGSRMATAYLANHREHGMNGFIGVGIRAYGDTPLDSNTNLNSVEIPVIDIYGNGGDGVDARHAAARKDLASFSDSYQMVLIDGADHRFNGHETEMVQAVVAWLKTQP